MSLLLDKLLEPFEGDVPCGEDISFDQDFLELENLISGTPEQQVGDSVIEAKDPEWGVIKNRCLKLFEKSKDLRLTTYLMLAEMSLSGLEGVRDGFKLLAGLTCDNWDLVWPQLDPDDDNDPLERVNILNSISPDASVYQDPMMFIQRLRDIKLSESNQLGKYSLKDIMTATGEIDAREGIDTPDMTIINASFMDTPIDKLQNNVDAAKESLDCLNRINDFLTEKLGAGNAPNFSRLLHELKQINHYLNESMEQRGFNDSDSAAEEEGGDMENDVVEKVALERTPTAAVPKGISGQISSRADVLKILEKICQYYDKYEPCSPVPLLLKRAQKLATMNFIDILQDITPDAVGQARLILGNNVVESENVEEL